MNSSTARSHIYLSGPAVDKWLQLGPVLAPPWAPADPLCTRLGTASWPPQQHHSVGAGGCTLHPSLALPRPTPFQQDPLPQHCGHRINTSLPGSSVTSCWGCRDAQGGAEGLQNPRQGAHVLAWTSRAPALHWGKAGERGPGLNSFCMLIPHLSQIVPGLMLTLPHTSGVKAPLYCYYRERR